MKAIELSRYGGPEALSEVERPRPEPGPGQVLVRIAATSLNPIDPKRASGAMRQIFPLTFPFVPGGDFSGIVEVAGSGVDAWRPGDEVYGYDAEGGAYAEWIAVDADKIATKPRRINHIEAASLALVGQTAAQALDAAGLETGRTVLIHGAGGAVGGVAVQLAHLRGATVIALARAADADRLRSYGADQVLDYDATPFERVVTGVDAVIDTVGGDVQQRSFGVLKPGGILVATSQPPVEAAAAKTGARAIMLATTTTTANLNALARWIDDGSVVPFVDRSYPLEEVAQAWREASQRHVNGKIVLTVGGGNPQ